MFSLKVMIGMNEGMNCKTFFWILQFGEMVITCRSMNYIMNFPINTVQFNSVQDNCF